MLLVGQSLVLHRGPLGEALRARNAGPIVANARRQVALGAQAIDVNIGREGTAEDLAWVAQSLRDAGIDVPLWLDSPRPDVLAAALRQVAHLAPLVANALPVGSVRERAGKQLLEAAATTVTPIVISLYLTDTPDFGDHATLAATRDAALDVAARAEAAGVPDRCYVDVLAWPLATDPERCRRSLRLAQTIASAAPHLHLVAAVGNVSYSLEALEARAARTLYAAAATRAGVHALILPVEDRACVEAAVSGIARPPNGTTTAWRRISALLEPPAA